MAEDISTGFARIYDNSSLLYEKIRTLLLSQRTMETGTLLKHLNSQMCAFSPGERTSDIPWLGSQNGVLSVSANINAVQDTEKLYWYLEVSGGITTSSFVQEAGSLDELRIYAGEPGTHRLRVIAMRGTEILGNDSKLLFVPWFFEVKTSSSFDNLLPIKEHREILLKKARDVAYFVLRPGNVRLIWNDISEEALNSLPEQFKEGFNPDDGMITSTPSTSGSTSYKIELHNHQDEESSSWGTAPDINDSFTMYVYETLGKSEAPSKDEKVLSYLQEIYQDEVDAAGNDDEDLGLLSEDALLYLELAGRRLGVRIARAVLEALGVSEVSNDGEEEGISGEIMTSQPADELRELLGLSLAQEDNENQTLPLDSLPGDLVNGPDSNTQWFDLVRSYSKKWSDNLQEREPGLEVLAGPISASVLDFLENAAPLPLPYGGYNLESKDNDQQQRWGGKERSVVNEDPMPINHEPPFVQQLQYDLQRFGIHIDIAESGVFDGDDSELLPSLSTEHHVDTTQRGVMQFQVSTRYAHRYLEFPKGSETASSELLRIKKDPDMKALEVDGIVNIATALTLRRWRFQRYRFPLPLSTKLEHTDFEVDKKLTSVHLRDLPKGSPEPENKGLKTIAHLHFFTSEPGPWPQELYDANFTENGEITSVLNRSGEGGLYPRQALGYYDEQNTGEDDVTVMEKIFLDEEFNNQFWVITGYADQRPVREGVDDSNYLIAMRRATAVFFQFQAGAANRPELEFPVDRVRVYVSTIKRDPPKPEFFPADRRVTIQAKRFEPNKEFFTKEELKEAYVRRLDALKENPFNRSDLDLAISVQRIRRAFVWGSMMRMLFEHGKDTPGLTDQAYDDLLRYPNSPALPALEGAISRIEGNPPFSSSGLSAATTAKAMVAFHLHKMRNNCYYRAMFIGDTPLEDLPSNPPPLGDLIDDGNKAEGDPERYTILGRKIFTDGLEGQIETEAEYMSGEEHYNYMSNPPERTDPCPYINIRTVTDLEEEADELIPGNLKGYLDKHYPD